MYGQWTGRNVKIADKRLQAKGFGERWGWPTETYETDGQICADCGKGHGGKLRLIWAGEYIGVDWKLQRRMSFRCRHCEKVVTFVQAVTDDGESAVERQVLYL